MFGAILAVASLATGVMSFMSSQEAARRQEKIARQNALAAEAETREQARREGLANRREESLARARAAASGLRTSGSISDFLEEQEKVNRSNERWLMRSGSRRAGIIQSEGKVQSQITRTQGIGSLLGGAKGFYQYGQGTLFGG